ncbi:MAG: ornithine cyclodeaminase family protein [Acidobacteria bacterium]|nr:ornithine cyclodeaminase family protein [Acidobacteriota bacterium]
MAILLREADVEKLADMATALNAVEQAFQLQGEGKAENAPRRRCRLERGYLHVMSASLPPLGVAGLKAYTSVEGKTHFHVYLYGSSDGTLLAVMEADRLGQIRTGAASGVATKYMARQDARRVGIIGAGWQARAQLEGVCAVRTVESIAAWSRTPEKLEAFCQEMTEKLGIQVQPAASPEETVKDKDIVITATTATEPVVMGDWLSKGTHINAIGANFLARQELDIAAIQKCACVIVDSAEQAALESGDLARAADAGAFYWEDARELSAVVIGDYPGREDDGEITLFKSHGIALEDVAFAAKIYDAAVKARVGEKLNL